MSLKDINVDCIYRSYGCKHTHIFHKMTTHVLDCLYRPAFCPVLSCRKQHRDMLKHLQIDHELSNVLDTKLKTPLLFPFDIPRDNHQHHWYRLVRIYHNGTHLHFLLLVTKVSDKYLASVHGLYTDTVKLVFGVKQLLTDVKTDLNVGTLHNVFGKPKPFTFKEKEKNMVLIFAIFDLSKN